MANDHRAAQVAEREKVLRPRTKSKSSEEEERKKSAASRCSDAALIHFLIIFPIYSRVMTGWEADGVYSRASCT